MPNGVIVLGSSSWLRNTRSTFRSKCSYWLSFVYVPLDAFVEGFSSQGSNTSFVVLRDGLSSEDGVTVFQ